MKATTNSGGVRALICALAALVGVACGDGDPVAPGPAPSQEVRENELIVVSEPVPFLATVPVVNSAAAPDISDADTVAYVSFAPRTFPRADRATITHLASGFSLTAPVLNGGLDPVPVPGAAGDTLEIRLLKGTAQLGVFLPTIPFFRPPRVVRTQPIRGKRDLPLNSNIIIVFSEPVDSTTVTRGGIELLKDDQPVAIDVIVSSDRLSTRAVPRNSLEAGTQYVIVVTRNVRDLSGDPLEQEYRSDFTTVGSSGPGTAVYISPAGAISIPTGLSVQLTAADLNGSPRPSSELSWSSTDSTVARVSAQGVVSGVSQGTADVTVTSGGLTATAVISVTIAADLVSVTAGGSHTCGLAPNGMAWCWGTNEFGQLGTTVVTSQALVPAPVETATRFTEISAGGDHTCAISTSGQLWCWGRNDFGQLGDGGVGNRTVPAAVGGGLAFVAVSGGEDHTCARTGSHAAYCWGRNDLGQLGDGSQVDRRLPVPVSGGLVFTTLSAGVEHTCGTTPASQHFCWGSNRFGQLSDPTVGLLSLTPNHPPNSAGFFDSFMAVASGKNHTCALKLDGSAWCGGTLVVAALEGRDASGGPTYGSLTCRNGDTGATMHCQFVMFAVSPQISYPIQTAGHEHSCSLDAGGTAYCWGRNDFGQRGDGTAVAWTYSQPDPAPVRNLSFSTIDAGAFHTCGITGSGDLYCWGRNDSGQLGEGTTNDKAIPRKVSS